METPTEVSEPIEIVRPEFPRGGYRAVLFDFDGTLSLIRCRWETVMIPMMVEVLLTETSTRETAEQLTGHVEEFVMRLTGKQTIYQMFQLAEEIKSRGGTPREALDYKRQYHDLLWQQVGERVAALKSGRARPEDMSVPGSHELLAKLRERDLPLYLASGTDLPYVRDELAALGMAEFFGEHVYGALDDYKNFSKAMIIERIIKDTGVASRELLAFGDGYVEIEETHRVGGVAIGVATNEETRQGVNAWKRERLIRAGADVIIGDYRCHDELLELLNV